MIALICFTISANFGWAQTYIVPFQGDSIIIANSGNVVPTTSITNVGSVPMLHYLDNNDGWLTIYPDNGCHVHLEGSYNTERYVRNQLRQFHDWITIYDGADTSAPTLSKISGSGYLDVTATTGPLTIRFQSNASAHFEGFDFRISSVAGCTCDNTYDLGFDLVGNTLEVSWTPAADGHAHHYTLEYGHVGFQPGTGTIIETDSAFCTIHNLLPERKYDFYVYYDCGLEGNPVQSTFQTPKDNPCITITSLADSNITCTTGECSSLYNHYPYICDENYALSQIHIVDYGEDAAESRHTIITSNARDPRTNSLLNRIMPGNTSSIRIGNWLTGSDQSTGPQAESITYDYLVDTVEAPILLLQYAAVMEDPEHSINEQPRFKLEILNSDGLPIDSTCGDADFVSDPTLGWNTYKYWSMDPNHYEFPSSAIHYTPHTIYWKDWTNVGIDLSRFNDQLIKIRLTTFDCKENFHYGYAYFNLDCKRKEIFSDVCGNNDALVYTAPSGFNYRWYFEDEDSVTLSTFQSISLDGTTIDRSRTLCCHTSFIGDASCGFVLKCDLFPRWPMADFIAERDSCTSTYHFTNTSSISNDGVTINPNSGPCERSHWDFGDGTSSDEYQPGAHHYSQPGYYTVTLISSINQEICSDTTTQRIFVPNYVSTFDTTVCNSILFEGQTFYSDTIINLHLSAFDGCDSIVTWNITVSPSLSTDIYDTICSNETYSKNGFNVNTSGEHLLNLQTIHGCDSIVTLHLTILNTAETVFSDSACNSYLWNGNVYTETGYYTQHFTTTQGCDSTVTLQLTIFDFVETTIIDTACNTYTWNDQIYTESGYYTQNFTNINGCDSIVTLQLTIYHSVKDTILTTTCDSYTWNDETYTQSGEYTQLFQTIHGCDSTVTLKLTIFNSVSSIIADSICDSYTWNNETYTQSGEYTQLFQTAHGCDSLVTLQLTIFKSVEQEIADSACTSYTWNEETYIHSGNYTKNFQTTHTCDSIVTLHLTIFPSYTDINIYDTIIENQLPYAAQGQIFNGNSEQDFLYTSLHGCDSLVHYRLFVHPNVHTVCDSTICISESPLYWNGRTFSETSTDSVLLHTSAGADSIVVMNVTINALPDVFIQVDRFGCDSLNAVLSATTASDNSYLWSTAETSDSIIVHTPGLYSVTVTDNNGCTNQASGQVAPYLRPDLSINIQDLCAGQIVTLVYSEHYGYGQQPIHSQIALNNMEGPWLTQLNDTTYKLGAPATIEHDTSIIYYITLIDTLGCTYDTTTTIQFFGRPIVNIYDTIVQNQLPFTYDGHEFPIGSPQNNAITLHHQTQHDCDSTVNYHLFIWSNDTTVLERSICSDELPYFWDGLVFETEGTQQLTLSDCHDADSTLILRLIVFNTEETSIIDSSCDVYIWNDETYTLSGDYTQHFQTVNGCDSMVKLHLTIFNSIETAFTDTACNSYTWNDTTYTSSGDYTQHFTTIHGCDSIVTSHLTIFNSTETAISDSACNSYTWNGETYSLSGNYTQHFNTIHHCDSTVTLDLTIFNAVENDITDSACNVYIWNDETYTLSGDYTQHFQTIHGCDSIVTLHLSIFNSTGNSISDTACDSYTWNDEVYTVTGDYTQSFSTIHGCDSIVTLHLTIFNSIETAFADTACDSYTWNESTYTQSGDYTQHFRTSLGCDSTVTLSLTIFNSIETAITDTACDSYTWENETYDHSGDYTQHFQTIHGCDSTVTLHLSIFNSTENNISDTACDSYTWNDNVYTSTGSYTQNFNTIHGCDSIVTLHLTIFYSVENSFADTACETYVWNGTEYSATGDYNQHLSTTSGCDSLVTLHLTIFNSVENAITESACDSHVWNDSVYTATGNYTQHFSTSHGCDSIVTLQLTIWPSSDSTIIFDTIVENQLPYLAQNHTFLGNAEQDFMYESTHGCDSLVHYHLFVHPNKHTVCDSSICSSEIPLHWNGITFNETATDSTILQAISGADSTVEMHVTVNSIPDVAIEVERFGCEAVNATLSATTESANCTYHWNTGESTDSIHVSTAGVYSVSITDTNGCSNNIAENITQYHSPIAEVNIPDLCAGETAIIHVGYESGSNIHLIDERSSIGISDSIFIPDGINCPPYGTYYRSNIQFTDFAPNAIIRDANDILYVRIKMEHSALEDIRIELGCPNGNTCKIIPDYQNDGWGDVPHSYFRLNMGVANRQQDNASCDVTLNAMGTPWNYIWSNNTSLGYQYAGGIHGYCYESANVQQTYNPYWDDGTVSYKVDSSDVANMTHIYHPLNNFNNMTGCPLNGSWYIQIQDLWAQDNGYLVEWELALTPDLLPLHQPSITLGNIEGPWVSRINDTTFQLNPPETLIHDTVVSYTITVYDSLGCSYDTTITTRFFSKPVVNIYDTIVQNQLPQVYNGHQFPVGSPQNNEVTFNLQTHHGCDSTIHYHLHIWPNVTTTLTRTICANELPYTWETLVFNTAGTQQHTLQTCHGADSTLQMTLFVNPTSSETIQEEIVENQLPHHFSGITFFTDVTDTILQFTTSNGCDSIIHYSLIVHRNASSEYDTAVCTNAFPFVWHTATFTEAGMLQLTLANQFGADSVLTLNVTEIPPYIEDHNDIICEGSEYHQYGFDVPYSQTIGKDHLQLSHIYESIIGCDSIVNLALDIIDTSLRIVSLTEDFCEEFYTELSVTGTFSNYVWSTDETSPTIIVDQPGIYSVTATEGNCTVSTYYTIAVCEFTLFIPNAITPSNNDGLNDFLYISEYSRRLIDDFEIRIFNRWGEEVFFSKDKNFKWYGEYKGKIHPNTIYNYKIHCSNLEGREFLFTGSITVL